MDEVALVASPRPSHPNFMYLFAGFCTQTIYNKCLTMERVNLTLARGCCRTTGRERGVKDTSQGKPRRIERATTAPEGIPRALVDIGELSGPDQGSCTGLLDGFLWACIESALCTSS